MGRDCLTRRFNAMDIIKIYLVSVIPEIIMSILLLILFLYGKKSFDVLRAITLQQKEELDRMKEKLNISDSKIASKVIDAIQNTNLATPTNATSSYNRLYAVFNKIKKATSDNLYNTMLKTKAARIAVYLFHNGTKTASGFTFVKISCVGEKVMGGSGIKEKILNHSNLPVNILDEMCGILYNTGRYIIYNDPNTMDTAKAQFISAPKIQYSQAVCLYDAENNVIGFILAEFEHAYIKQTSDEEYENLKSLCLEFAPIFSYSDYVNLTTIKDDD